MAHTDGPWVRFFPSDWLAGTRGMTAAETGVYITLVCLMYEREGPIVRDDARQARLCGLPLATYRKVIDVLIDQGKVHDDDGHLMNERVLAELKKRSDFSEAGRKGATSRWNKKDNKNNGRKMRSHSDGNADAMLTTTTTTIDSNSLRSLAPQAASSRRVGTRLPTNWKLPKSWGQWAIDTLPGATVELVRSQADQFKDYWIAKTGSGATKLDWEATWRNWMRTAVSRLGKPSASAPKLKGIALVEEQLRQEIADEGHGGAESADREAVPRLAGGGR